MVMTMSATISIMTAEFTRIAIINESSSCRNIEIYFEFGNSDGDGVKRW